jgi:membrane-associated protein
MLDPISIIKGAGLIGIFFIIFAESGLLIGFFLPGDTLLFAAGIFANQGSFPISLLIIGCVISAIIGDNLGYWTGKKIGRRLFERDDSILFRKERLIRAESFFNRYGPSAVIISRFIPVVRTFVPVVSGVLDMKYRLFVICNVFGAFMWIFSVSLLGYYFGALIPNIDAFLMPIIVGVVVFSLLPILFHFVRNFLKNKK